MIKARHVKVSKPVSVEEVLHLLDTARFVSGLGESLIDAGKTFPSLASAIDAIDTLARAIDATREFAIFESGS